MAQLRAEPLCCHPLGFSSNHSWPRSCQEQLEVWISSPVFRTETVGAAQGRAQSRCPSEVLAVPVNTSCMQAGLSSHFVFQGRSLSEEVLWFCVTEQCVLACVCKVVFGAAPAIDLGPGLFCGVLLGLGVLGQPERSLLSNFFTPGTSIQKKNGFRQKKQPGIKSACISLNSEEP